jgi:hypothetical protein
MMMHVLQPVPDITVTRGDRPRCEELIARAMAKNPDDRFSTASDWPKPWKV